MLIAQKSVDSVRAPENRKIVYQQLSQDKLVLHPIQTKL